MSEKKREKRKSMSLQAKSGEQTAKDCNEKKVVEGDFAIILEI